MTRAGAVSSAAPRILVVEDDATVAEVVTRYLERESYRVEVASDGEDGLARALADPPDLIVLDLMLPGVDGLELCRRVRALAPVPVVMLTARADEADRVVGLEAGADDYVVKPFSPRELTARVKAVLRRSRAPVALVAPGARPAVDGLGVDIDLVARRATADGRELDLTAREFELLAFLVRNAGRAFRREELLEHVWGYAYGDTATVTVHVCRLREKVEADPANPARIQTVWGVGYRFGAAA